MADAQVRALYGRDAAGFPPPGLDCDDAYFARTVPVSDATPGRLYVGFLAPARDRAHCLAPLAGALLAAPEVLFAKREADREAMLDAWWTLLVYHSSLKGVGISRNAEEGIASFLARYQGEQADAADATPWRRRERLAERITQLTSNMSADQNAETFDRLRLRFEQPGALGMVLATNMISVGLDVGRLALMVINGQPLSTAEYIQASSRVGRGDMPGLVIANYFRDQALLERLAREAARLDSDKQRTALHGLAGDHDDLLGNGPSTFTELLEQHGRPFSRAMLLFFLRDHGEELLDLRHPRLKPMDLAIAALLFGAAAGWMGMPAAVRATPGLQAAVAHRMARLAHRSSGSALALGDPPERPQCLRESFLSTTWGKAQQEAAGLLLRGLGRADLLRTRISLGKGDYRLQVDGRGAHLLLDGEVKAVTVEPDRAGLLNQLADQRASLTRDQVALVDMVDANERILCTGGAGTGKTFLALEFARRWSACGRQVLLACASTWQVPWLRRRFKAPNLTVAMAGSARREARRLGIERFDALIVDEGQDLLDLSLLDRLDAVLEGGLADGRWCFFHDANQQAGLIGSCDPDALARLSSHRPARYRLTQDCRNTRQVLALVQTRLGADMGMEGTGDGPEVRVLSPADDQAAIRALAAELERLIEHGGLHPGQVTILSPLAFPKSIASRLPPPWCERVAVLDGYAMRDIEGQPTGFARVVEFKGLENEAILVVDLPPGPSASIDATAYVSMSRARVLLTLIERPDPRWRR